MPSKLTLRLSLCAAISVATLATLAFAASAVGIGVSAARGINQFQDDAFYYIIPARHFLESGVFTFDGVTTTNGFHPLWMLVILALLKTVGPGASPETIVLGVSLVERAALASTIGLCIMAAIYSMRRGLPWATGHLAVLVLLLYPRYVIFEQGMETTLAVFLYVAAVTAFILSRPIWLGVLIAFLSLCRLDTTIFIGLPLALFAAATFAATSWARIAVFAPMAVVAMLIAGLNLATNGHAVPISGAIKSSFPAITWHFSFFYEPLNIARLYGFRTLFEGINIILCTAVLALGLLLCHLWPRFERKKILAIGTTAALLLVNLVFFQKWEKSVDPRYFALPMTGSLFVLGMGLQGLSRHVVGRMAQRARFSEAALPASLIRVAPTFMIAVTLAITTYGWFSKAGGMLEQLNNPIRKLFEDLADSVPSDAVIAATDAGALSFWTNRRVVNLDGVISDFGYQRRIRDGGLEVFLKERGVTHIATTLWDREQTHTGRPTEPMYRHQIDPEATNGHAYDCHMYYVYSYVYAVYSDRLCLRPQQEVFRRAVGKDGIADASYVVYKLSN